MKKLLSLALVLVMLAAAVITSIPAGAEEVAPTGTDNILSVSVNGGAPTDVKVGNEFIVRIGINVGDAMIMNGQVHMDYDCSLASFVPVTKYSEYYEADMVEAYCFPGSILRANVVMNYGAYNTVSYNFTKPDGVSVFNSTDKLFARFRFKAIAPGTMNITHTIQYMINVNEQRIFYKGQPVTEPAPVIVETIEPSEGCVGDIDGDGDITILDATFMQRVMAGEDLTYDAEKSDVTGDKIVSLKDAVIARKYLAGISVSSDIGKWLFASEA